ncbi:MAG: hypothetical protein AAF902_20295 [Chloroflexota bacterium]
MPSAIICDTTVWLYLGLAKQEHLLFKLYDEVCVTESVCAELDIGRTLRDGVIDPRKLEAVNVVETKNEDLARLPASDMGEGELTTVAYALANDIDVAGLDDRAARSFAKTMGLVVVGTPGILLAAKKFGFLGDVKSVLEQMMRDGFY